jgi:hypothetical protein
VVYFLRGQVFPENEKHEHIYATYAYELIHNKEVLPVGLNPKNLNCQEGNLYTVRLIQTL